MSLDPAQQAYNQYNTDDTQWQNDCADAAAFAQQWKDLIATLADPHVSIAQKWNVVMFQLLGPTIIDGYDQSKQNIQGDLMNMTSDMRNLQNVAQTIYNESNGKPLTTTQENQFSEALNDLYKIYNSQQTPGTKQWLDANDDANGLQGLGAIYSAFSGTPSQPLTPTQVGKMSGWWPTKGSNPALPNPNLALLSNNFQTLSGVTNGFSQAAQTTASYLTQAQNSIEGTLKNIYTSMINLEANAVNATRSGS